MDMRILNKKLIDTCNESGLPLDAMYFVIKDLLRDITDALEMADKQKLAQKVSEVVPQDENPVPAKENEE